MQVVDAVAGPTSKDGEEQGLLRRLAGRLRGGAAPTPDHPVGPAAEARHAMEAAEPPRETAEPETTEPETAEPGAPERETAERERSDGFGDDFDDDDEDDDGEDGGDEDDADDNEDDDEDDGDDHDEEDGVAADPEHPELSEPSSDGDFRLPERWDPAVPVHAELARHSHLRETLAQLKANRDKINSNTPQFWRRRARRFFNAIVERRLYGAHLPPAQGHLRSFDVLSDKRLQYNMVRGLNWYSANHGFFPNMFNPRRFTEKLLVTKFFAPIPMPSPGDKLANHLYIPPAIRHLVRAPKRVWSSHLPVVPESFDAPPGVYYFKANHASGANFKFELPLTEETHAKLTDLASKWLGADYGVRGGEWWYELLHRKVYIEESYSAFGESATDWKVFVLNGRAAIVQVDVNRAENHIQLIYDRDFNYLPVEFFFNTGDPISRPAEFDDIVTVAEAIGRQFEFARVDLYNTESGIVLGEITFAPGGARLRLRSPELDMWMGEKWKSGFFEPDWRPRSPVVQP